MKKLFSTFLLAIGFANDVNSKEVVNTKFELILLQAKQSHEYMPVWESFVNTEFFVVAIPNTSEDASQKFIFSIFKGPQSNNQPMVLISESLDKMANAQSTQAIKLSGSELIQMLNPEVGILIACSEGAFGIPKEQVRWLRESIKPIH